MIDPGEVTPIDRPLMRSDLDAVRVAVHNVQQLAVRHYNEATATRRESRLLAIICVFSACVSLGCSLVAVAQ